MIGLNALVNDMQGLLRRVAGDGVELATMAATGLWPVRVQAGALEELFLVLVVDACRGMPNGGTLTIETRNVTLAAGDPARPAQLAPGHYVALAVGDTGRAPGDVLRAAMRGTGRDGLGVRLALELAEANGGYAVVLQQMGGGTTVLVLLPSAEPETAAGPAPRGAGTTVLVVDDDRLMLRAAARAVRLLGYTAIEADSPEAAMRACEAAGGQVQLLLTDVVLPGMDGPELAARITKRWPAVRTLFMSGFSEDALALRDAAPSAVLVEKPFSVDGLAAKLRVVLG